MRALLLGKPQPQSIGSNAALLLLIMGVAVLATCRAAATEPEDAPVTLLAVPDSSEDMSARGPHAAEEGAAHELEDEQNAVLVVGGAAETGASGGSGIYGGTAGLEYTVIEHWLEIEAGVSLLANSPRRELGADLAFKKPFRIGEHSEMMLGAGPFVTRATDTDGNRMLHGWEVVADFQFWTSHTGGWYVEPVWGRASETRERTWGVNIGWLIGAHD